jgi:hypothetical protein
MVLIQRMGVLGFVLGVVLLGGCSESLFGARRADQGGDGGGGPDGDVPSSCPAACIADAAADFDGTPRGTGGHWQYLDDRRDRTWSPMTAGTTGMTGADANNRITTCAANPSAPACRALPGALLVSSAGSTSSADPAIEFTAPTNQVIQLSLHAFVPSGADQTIRLYRNSREDVLFTGTAAAGNTLSHAITLDALAGDRFLVAVAPIGNGAMGVGLQLFVNATGTSFPSTCQIAVPFENTSAGTTKDVCHDSTFAQFIFSPPSSSTMTSVVLGTGPFNQQGSAADIVLHNYIEGRSGYVLDWSRDITLQFWVRLRAALTPSGARLFSDLDPEFCGGVEIGISPGTGGPRLNVRACIDSTLAPNTAVFGQTNAAYLDDGSWQFVRVVRSGGNVNVCLNGARGASLPVELSPSPEFHTYYSPSLGREVASSSSDPLFDGWIDDVRAITGALPCE